MINEYNEAVSEKANDVAYFADAYLKVLGAIVKDENLEQIRNNRIINFPGNVGKMDNSMLTSCRNRTAIPHRSIYLTDWKS